MIKFDWNSLVKLQPTPGFNSSMLALTPAGGFWIWGDGTSATMRTDPLQGPVYHINKAKDAASGGRRQRFEEMYAAVPMSDVIHMDAYRDIDVSYETDAAGYISEDEEAACGLDWDLQWLRQHNLSLGVEGPNGMASVGGPNAPAMDVFDYYWHGEAESNPTLVSVFTKMFAGQSVIFTDYEHYITNWLSTN